MLWVRETWCPRLKYDENFDAEDDDNPRYIKYKADHKDGESPSSPMDFHSWPSAWRPSIHMPRAAARLFLEVADVRAQRVQEIGEEDAKAEGVQTERDHYGGDTPLMYLGTVRWHRYDSEACSAVNARESFRTLWDSIHGPGAWALNLWVWAYTFRPATKPEDWA